MHCLHEGSWRHDAIEHPWDGVSKLGSPKVELQITAKERVRPAADQLGDGQGTHSWTGGDRQATREASHLECGTAGDNDYRPSLTLHAPYVLIAEILTVVVYSEHLLV